jgi:hypothetical protein
MTSCLPPDVRPAATKIAQGPARGPARAQIMHAAVRIDGSFGVLDGAPMLLRASSHLSSVGDQPTAVATVNVLEFFNRDQESEQ